MVLTWSAGAARVRTRREREDAAFHNPLCPVPIKRCCHAYGQELTGRSQHGHGSTRTRVCTFSVDFSLSLSSREACWCGRRCRKRRQLGRKRRTTVWLGSIWTSGCTGNYRTGLPITVHRTLTYAWIREAWAYSGGWGPQRARTDQETKRKREREKWGDCANAQGSLHHAL